MRGDACSMPALRPRLSASTGQSVDGAVVPRGPQRPRWREPAARRRVHAAARDRPSLAPRAEFLTVSEAHQVAVPRSLKVHAPEPDFESGQGGGPSCPWSSAEPRYSVRITIERAGDESICSASPYLARQLSVRKVVPTLTSNERWDQPLDGRC